MYICICNSVKEGDIERYHLIGTNCGKCMSGVDRNKREDPGVLYGVVLVNKKTFERECIKVGIASGKDWRHVIKRSYGFKGYDLRIQRTWAGTLYRCWEIEQALHKEFSDDRFEPKHKFGGHTECFKIDSKILSKFPSKNEI